MGYLLPLVLVSGIGAGAAVYVASYVSPSANLILRLITLGIALLIFTTTRHIQLVAAKRQTRWRTQEAPTSAATAKDDYFLFVLGSGGHTKEMLMMMDDGFCDFSRTHRRYLISSGDKMSENHLEDYETDLAQLCATKKCTPGSFDKKIVTRARRVHQPLWSTPFSAFRSVLDIFPCLLSPPSSAVGQRRRLPTQIFSNGPATGFFVALAVHILKLFYIVPQDSMRFVYVESWARISTLSLTGKLLHCTGIADLFLVQHDEVAKKYGLQNAGEMVFNARRVGL
ncbi:hypothetical protein VHEMI01902 [[Torrubiella] hemipterigena]|uniref:UDP-N-acetylglucosamine transferase subunit ALG14 n=1 Tax=[Torrubiella] hemipterigena TaxID=1531966 RepID=A0A0A1SU96_9HYPO|nr:hypothetical protein VHEMI01902 [[Torrubiella] hemipterigena]